MNPSEVVTAHTLLLELAALEKVFESLKYARAEIVNVQVIAMQDDRGGAFSVTTLEARKWIAELIASRVNRLRQLGVER